MFKLLLVTIALAVAVVAVVGHSTIAAEQGENDDQLLSDSVSARFGAQRVLWLRSAFGGCSPAVGLAGDHPTIDSRLFGHESVHDGGAAC